MQPSDESDRRACLRYDDFFQVTIQPIPSSAEPPINIFHGQSRNVSERGMCVLLDEACQVSSLLKCRIMLPGSSASIPTLGRVRWIRNCDDEKLLTGVEFLL